MPFVLLVPLYAATAFACGAVMQHRAASQVALEPGAGPVRLLWRLVRTPRWLLAVGLGLLGVFLQARALAIGSLVTVQPILATGLVISLVIGYLLDRRHPGRPLPSRRQWVAAVVVVSGLALFLSSARPRGGGAGDSQLALAACVAASLALSAGALRYSRRAGARYGALVLGVAAGASLGVSSLTLNALVAYSPVEWLTTWRTAALAVLGLSGTGLAQLAYRAGPLTASLPALSMSDPLVALATAGPVFGEMLAPGLLARAGQAAGVVMLLTGLVVLARSQAVHHDGEPPH